MTIVSLTLSKNYYESSAKMGYTLQHLGDCALQTPCCFASTLLGTLKFFFAYAPEYKYVLLVL